jgi:hypothetical protein
MLDAEHYRARAKETRAQAETFIDPEAKRILLIVAQQSKPHIVDRHDVI